MTNLLKKPLEKMPQILDKVRYFIAEKPTELTFEEVIDKATNKTCKFCKNSTKCWVQNYNSTTSALHSLQSTYTEFGAILEEDFPTHFSQTCHKLRMLKNHINQLNKNAKPIENMPIKRDKVHYLYDFVPEIESRLQREFRDKGISVSSIVVVETMQKNIEISLNIRTKHPIEEVVALCQAVTGRKMRVSGLTNRENGRLSARIIQRPAFEIELGVAMESKEGECGDKYNYSQIGENKAVIALSDGCGTGKIASKYAEITSNLIKTFLVAGIPKKKAVDLISSVLLLGKDNEKFATADISIIDLYNGNLELIKLGANSSYILRRNERKLERISSTSLPVGVLASTKLDNYKTHISNGDYLIMLSDGIESPNSPWLADFLDNPILKNASAKTLAHKILAQSQSHTKNDDKLILIAKFLRA